MPDLNTALYDFVLAVLGLSTLLVTRYAIPWLKAHVGEKRLDFAESAAMNAVKAAEIIGGTSGAQKFENAKERARDLVSHNLSDEQWRTIIEAAVKDFKSWGVELKQPAPVVEEL